MHSNLPVEEVIPELREVLASERRAVLEASPGAGKTTRVPLALMDEPWLEKNKILMLEPRRLAARACAHYMAGILKEPVGKTVGYQIRMEQKISSHTRVFIITEGILVRMIQEDPGLENTGLVIFDEFHERHIHSDLGLALCLDAARAFREDLRILVMSATMDGERVSKLLGGAPLIRSKGKVFFVDTFHLPPGERPGRQGSSDFLGPYAPVLRACTTAVKKAVQKDPGDILVFLPGRSEIKQVQASLGCTLGTDVRIAPLFGNMPLTDQVRAIAPSLPGKRKIVLATSLAETSLTIEGIRVVVDSGLMRVSRFSPGTGMDRLETVPVSRASADQRRGRAGRTAPGTCYRAWPLHVHQGLVPYTRPEIQSADLASLVLDLALWGVKDPAELSWMDLPPESSIDQARALLRELNALDSQGRITEHGRNIAGAGVHPRLAHMILEGKKQGLAGLACRLAALLEAGDILDGPGFDPDVRPRLDILEKAARTPRAHPVQGVRAGTVRQVLNTANHLQGRLNLAPGNLDAAGAGTLLAAAFPDRVARKRENLSYVMASGSGVCFREHNSLSHLEYIVAAQVDGNPRNASVFLAAPYSALDLARDFKDRITTEDRVDWDPVSQRVRAVSRVGYGCLVLRETPLSPADPDAVKAALIQGIRLMGMDLLPWNRKPENLRHRVLFLRRAAGQTDLPDFSDKALEAGLENWLGPFLTGLRSAGDLKQVDLFAALAGQMTWQQRQRTDQQAPTHILVPSGSRIPLQYSQGGRVLESPVLAVRLQEMFGLAHTPESGGIPVTVHLLSPAGRPVQITRDLGHFWQTTYREVKKDLMGRYPKHFWPDNPQEALPTRRAKPRKI